MGTHRIRYLCLLFGVVSCDEVVAPEASPFGDIVALQLTAAPVGPPFRTDSAARFSFVLRNPLARDVVIWGNHCLIQLEVKDDQGLIVFPTGTRACATPLEARRIPARDSLVGGIALSGALGDAAMIGRFALPPGTFRMRVVVEGITDLSSYNPVGVQSPWSELFVVLP